MKKISLFYFLSTIILLLCMCTPHQEHNILIVNSKGFDMYNFTYPKKWDGGVDYTHKEWVIDTCVVNSSYKFDFTIDSVYRNGLGLGKMYKVYSDGNMVNIRVNDGYTYTFPEEFLYNVPISSKMSVNPTGYNNPYWEEHITSIHSNIDMNNFWK